VISRDSKEISWNRIENSTSPNYFSIYPLKADTRSDRHKSLCQFEWFHWIRKKSYEIVSRTRLNSFYFSIHFACFCKTNKTLEVTGINYFVSLSDFMGFERNPMKSYRELDKPSLTSRYIPLRRTLEVTGINHFVSSSDGEATAEPLYRELDKPRFTSRYILLVFSKQTKHSKWHWSNTLSVRVISLDSKEIPWNRIENST